MTSIVATIDIFVEKNSIGIVELFIGRLMMDHLKHLAEALSSGAQKKHIRTSAFE